MVTSFPAVSLDRVIPAEAFWPPLARPPSVLTNRYAGNEDKEVSCRKKSLKFDFNESLFQQK